jgi:hypothetical protein
MFTCAKILIVFIKGLVGVAVISLITKWSPIYERSIFMMVGHSGTDTIIFN